MQFDWRKAKLFGNVAVLDRPSLINLKNKRKQLTKNCAVLLPTLKLKWLQKPYYKIIGMGSLKIRIEQLGEKKTEPKYG